jgi:catalase
VKNLTREEATKIAGQNPDFLIQDLFESIEKGDYPTWNVYVQVMDPSEAERYRWNIFDMTKVWPHSDFPLRQIGKLTLNRNVRISLSFVSSLHTKNLTDGSLSPGTTLPILNRRPFPLPLWYLALRPQQTQVGYTNKWGECIYIY